jgi:hypothetical protein
MEMHQITQQWRRELLEHSQQESRKAKAAAEIAQQASSISNHDSQQMLRQLAEELRLAQLDEEVVSRAIKL